LQDIELPVNKKALVVGGGLAGMTCALSIAEQGHDVYLVEKEASLGGIANRIHSTLEGLDVQSYLGQLKKSIYRSPLIHVYTQAMITQNTGYLGNFITDIVSERGVTDLKHGATVIATGANVYQPEQYLYGQDHRVLTHLELEDMIACKGENFFEAKSIVMIQCVGCRNVEKNYCSRICCGESIKNALKLKELNPEVDIFILYRDMRTYGKLENYYREASEKGVNFIRYKPEASPRLEIIKVEGQSKIQVTVMDYILGIELSLHADLVALAAAIIPEKGNKDISHLFKVPLGPDGFFKEAHVKLRPVEFSTDGVFLCGMSHYPKHILETVSQAYGAAERVVALLSHDMVTVSGSVCEVEENRCIGCGACVSACTYNAIEIRKTKQGAKANVNPIICKGDGLCNAKCPTGAIFLKHFTDEALNSQIDAICSKEKLVSSTDVADRMF
jgi:heterodisulfide reductase subunit A